MGYESRVYAMLRYEPKSGFVFAEKIAVFDLACMGYKFPKLFKKDLDFTFYSDFQGTEEETDCYGEKIKCTEDIDGVIEWLESNEKIDPYRRQRLFLDFLKSAKNIPDCEQEKLVLCHYGY